MAENFVFADTGDGSYGPNFGALAGTSNRGDYVETGMGITADFTVPDIDVASGQAYVVRNNVTFTDDGGSTRDRLRTVSVVQISAKAGISLPDTSGENYVYLQSDADGSDAPSIDITSTAKSPVPDEELLIGVVDTSNNTVDERNRNPSVEFLTAKVNGNLTDSDDNIIYDNTNNHLEQNRLENDSVTVSGGSAINGAGSIALGGSGTVSVSSGGIGTTELDTGISPSWSSSHTFGAGLTVTGNIEGDTQTVWDETADEIPNGALPSGISAGNLNLGSGIINSSDSLKVALTSTDVTGTFLDFSFGNNLSASVTGDTVTINASNTSDTTTDVSNNGGTPVVTETSDINFSNALTATDDGDGTATVNVPTDGIGTDELDRSVAYNWSGSHDFGSDVTLSGTGNLKIDDGSNVQTIFNFSGKQFVADVGSATSPGYAFYGNNQVGMHYNEGNSEISFTIKGSDVLNLSSGAVETVDTVNLVASSGFTSEGDANFTGDSSLGFGGTGNKSIGYNSSNTYLTIRDGLNDIIRLQDGGAVEIHSRNFNVGSDIATTGQTTIWDSGAGEIPDSAMGTISNSTLANDSITVTGGDGISGGSASLGGSLTVGAELTASNDGTAISGVFHDFNFSSNISGSISGDTITISSTDTDTRTDIEDDGSPQTFDTETIDFRDGISASSDGSGGSFAEVALTSGDVTGSFHDFTFGTNLSASVSGDTVTIDSDVNKNSIEYNTVTTSTSSSYVKQETFNFDSASLVNYWLSATKGGGSECRSRFDITFEDGTTTTREAVEGTFPETTIQKGLSHDFVQKHANQKITKVEWYVWSDDSTSEMEMHFFLID